MTIICVAETVGSDSITSVSPASLVNPAAHRFTHIDILTTPTGIVIGLSSKPLTPRPSALAETDPSPPVSLDIVDALRSSSHCPRL